MFRMFIIILLLFSGWFVFHEPIILQPPGILATEDPLITVPPGSLIPWQRDNYTITPLKEYHVQARVLSKQHYLMGKETDLSYYDLVLGWKEMSDTKVLDSLEISQSYRWYEVRGKSNEILVNPSLIQFESGNMHIIADNKEVLRTIKKIKVGNVIILDGYLVGIQGPDGWRWTSSVESSSNGSHGCKVIWVNNVVVLS